MVRFKLLISLVAAVLLLAACGTKDRSVSGRIVGTWQGENSVEQKFTDSGGFSFTQNFEAPATLVYSADSTLTLSITISDANSYLLEGNANTDGNRLIFCGKLTMGEVLDVTGEMTLNEAGELFLSYQGYSEVGIEHKAEAILTRIK